MKKFEFEEAKALGDALSPEEMKDIAVGKSTCSGCVCYWEMSSGQIFTTSPYPDNTTTTGECWDVCADLCSNNPYCKRVISVCFPDGSGSGSGSDEEGSGSGSE